MSSVIPAAFISYSRIDSDFTMRLAADLKAAGANVWLDHLDIKPGHHWDRSIEAALTAAPQMLLILSPASVASENVMDEVSFAIERKKTILPILFQDCEIPFRLRRIQYIDLRSDYARGLKDLLQNLELQQLSSPVNLVALPPDQRTPDQQMKPATKLAQSEEVALTQPQAAEPPAVEEAHRLPKAEERRPANANALIDSRPEATARPPAPSPSGITPFIKWGAATAVLLGVTAILYLAFGPSRHPAQPSANPPQTNPSQLENANSGQPTQPALKSSQAAAPAPVGATGSVAPPITSHTVRQPSNQSQPPTASAPSPDPGESAQSLHDRALALQRLEDYSSAAPLYEKACHKGSARSCNDLSHLYEDGLGVTQDRVKAAALARQGCDGGDSTACLRLGVAYLKGMGVPQSSATAAKLLQKACDGAARGACIDLGDLYSSGDGVARDYNKAATLYQQACESNFVVGCKLLADAYADGRGVPKSTDMAIKIYKKTCALGYQPSCARLKDQQSQ